MNFLHFDKFLESLPFMGKGMFGIFVVCAIVILAMTILGKFPDKK